MRNTFLLPLILTGILCIHTAVAAGNKSGLDHDTNIEIKDTTAVAALDFSKTGGDKTVSWTEIERFVKESPSSVSWSTDERCPECGGKVIEIHYKSSEESWKHLAGREGILTVCPKCMKQLGYLPLKMN